MKHDFAVGAAFLDDVDSAAMAQFQQMYGDVRFGDVAIVIAAYNEAANLGAVLDSLPTTVCGLPATALVVDDGSTDETVAVAREHGAYVCVPALNRGQGAALRLGYHVAKGRDAQVIATTDADGQYDASEIAVVVKPLIEGRADFVTGSRRLGLYTTDDAVRHAGVRIFAKIVSVIARRRVTDTSNGLRAFRAEVIEHLTLEQPQYQATELLIGVYYRGFRVLEIGTSMHQRSSGSSKKGRNFVYGYRFGRVILHTWLRELKRNRSEGRRMRDPARALAPMQRGQVEADEVDAVGTGATG